MNICCTLSYCFAKMEKVMSLDGHLQELRRKHQTLEDEVEKALRTPSFDDLELAELKRKKLRLKEQISRLTAN